MATIGQSAEKLQASLRKAVSEALPQAAGYAFQVEVLENERKKRSDASRDSWRPSVGEIRITFGGSASRDIPEASSIDESPVAYATRSETQNATEQTRRAELIKALATAEQRPGLDIVVLTWFRDKFLSQGSHEWAMDPGSRDSLLRDAINQGMILTAKAPNPKNPGFPVTTIRLNRQHAEVQVVIGLAHPDIPAFRPLAIRGEPLSATVLRDRR